MAKEGNGGKGCKNQANGIRRRRTFERHHRLGNVIPVYYNVMQGSPGTGFFLASLGDIRVFDVEVLLKRNEFLLGKIYVVEALAKIGASTI